MQDSINSIHFLWYAYVLVFTAHVVFAVWLAKSWSRLNKTKR